MRNPKTLNIALRHAPHRAPLGKGSLSYQAEAEPKAVLAGESLVRRFADWSRQNAVQAELMIRLVEGFVEHELKEGNRLDFGLVSFYPHLNGTLSARDADPMKEGLKIVPAVKARQRLRSLLAVWPDQLIPVNKSQKRAYAQIWNVVCEGVRQRGKIDTITADRVVGIVGTALDFDESAPDEGIWLENWRGERVAKAEILHHEIGYVQCRFPGPLPSQRLELVVSTRLGKGPEFKVNDFHHKVNVIP